MSEEEQTDQWLRQTMGATPQPRISPDFDRRLNRRLKPRRLTPKGRWIMAAYTVFMLILSVWLMRSLSIDWRLISIATLAPLILALVVQFRQRPQRVSQNR